MSQSPFPFPPVHPYTGKLGQYPLGTTVRTLANSYVRRSNELLVIIEHLGIIRRSTGPSQAYSLGTLALNSSGKHAYLGGVYHDMIEPVDISEPFKAKQ